MGKTIKSIDEIILELDAKTLDEYDVIYRYKKSILIDSFFTMIIFTPIIILLGKFIDIENGFASLIFSIVALLFFSSYFLSDKIFNGASLGKRIYKIKIVGFPKKEPISIYSVIYRRFLELWIHPSFTKMNFLEKSKHIDKQTGTKIVSTDK